MSPKPPTPPPDVPNFHADPHLNHSDIRVLTKFWRFGYKRTLGGKEIRFWGHHVTGGQRRLAGECGVGWRTFQRSVARLEQLGYIWTENLGRARGLLYHLVESDPQGQLPLDLEPGEPSGRNERTPAGGHKKPVENTGITGGKPKRRSAKLAPLPAKVRHIGVSYASPNPPEPAPAKEKREAG